MNVAPTKPGWVYILTNEAMPGLVKIGLTTRTPKERAAELSGATGVPLPFVVAWARAVSDCDYVEKVVHRMLDNRRVNGKRESFRCDVATARQVIEAGAGAGSMLRRRYRAEPPLLRSNKRRNSRGRRRRGRDLTGFGLAVSAVVLLAVLALFKPSLPGWLPDQVRQSFLAVEGWR